MARIVTPNALVPPKSVKKLGPPVKAGAGVGVAGANLGLDRATINANRQAGRAVPGAGTSVGSSPPGGPGTSTISPPSVGGGGSTISKSVPPFTGTTPPPAGNPDPLFDRSGQPNSGQAPPGTPGVPTALGGGVPYQGAPTDRSFLYGSPDRGPMDKVNPPVPTPTPTPTPDAVRGGPGVAGANLGLDRATINANRQAARDNPPAPEPLPTPKVNNGGPNVPPTTPATLKDTVQGALAGTPAAPYVNGKPIPDYVTGMTRAQIPPQYQGLVDKFDSTLKAAGFGSGDVIKDFPFLGKILSSAPPPGTGAAVGGGAQAPIQPWDPSANPWDQGRGWDGQGAPQSGNWHQPAPVTTPQPGPIQRGAPVANGAAQFAAAPTPTPVAAEKGGPGIGANAGLSRAEINANRQAARDNPTNGPLNAAAKTGTGKVKAGAGWVHNAMQDPALASILKQLGTTYITAFKGMNVAQTMTYINKIQQDLVKKGKPSNPLLTTLYSQLLSLGQVEGTKEGNAAKSTLGFGGNLYV